MHRRAEQLDYALLGGHGPDDTVHDNYHNNEFRTVRI